MLTMQVTYHLEQCRKLKLLGEDAKSYCVSVGKSACPHPVNTRPR